MTSASLWANSTGAIIMRRFFCSNCFAASGRLFDRYAPAWATRHQARWLKSHPETSRPSLTPFGIFNRRRLENYLHKMSIWRGASPDIAMLHSVQSEVPTCCEDELALRTGLQMLIYYAVFLSSL